MQQQFFKKDPRTWLHKNSQSAINRSHQPSETCMDEIPEIDPTFEQAFEKDFPMAQPLITDIHGRVFKKDSRTWLHKSSDKLKIPPTTEAASNKPNRPKRFLRPANHPQLKPLGDHHDNETRLSSTVSTTEMLRSNLSRLQKQQKRTMDSTEHDEYPSDDEKWFSPIPRLHSDSHLDLSTMTGKYNKSGSDPRVFEKMTTKFYPTDLHDDEMEEEVDDDDDESDGTEAIDDGRGTDSNDEEDDGRDFIEGEWVDGKEAVDDDVNKDDVDRLTRMDTECLVGTTMELTQDGLIKSNEMEPPFATVRRHKGLLDSHIPCDLEGKEFSDVKSINLELEERKRLPDHAKIPSPILSDYQLSIATEYLHVRSPCAPPAFDPQNI